MNMKRFSARTSREALHLVRRAFGADAVVLSTRPCDGGVEVNISSLPPESGPDPVAEIIEQKSAAVMYRANLKVVKTAEEMIGDILDTRG